MSGRPQEALLHKCQHLCFCCSVLPCIPRETRCWVQAKCNVNPFAYQVTLLCSFFGFFGTRPLQFFEFGKTALQFVYSEICITISSFPHPCHFVHLKRIRTHCHLGMRTRMHTDITLCTRTSCSRLLHQTEPARGCCAPDLRFAFGSVSIATPWPRMPRPFVAIMPSAGAAAAAHLVVLLRPTHPLQHGCHCRHVLGVIEDIVLELEPVAPPELAHVGSHNAQSVGIRVGPKARQQRGDIREHAACGAEAGHDHDAGSP